MAEQIRSGDLSWAGIGEDILIATARIAAGMGVESIEFGWEVLNRVCLVREHKPRDEDHVRWFVKGIRVTMVNEERFTIKVVGTFTVEPGGDHEEGCSVAARNFLDQLGVDTATLWGEP